MSQAIATLEDNDTASIAAKVLLKGDLAKLSDAERVNYFTAICKSLGLNPLTRPIDAITDKKGKLVLYVKKDGTDQLRRLHNVSIVITSREKIDGVYIVTARASVPTDRDVRTDESVGATSIGNLKGDELCNAIMKAETKAKRRVTLSICGLGFLDESEIETVEQAPALKVEPKPVPELSEAKLRTDLVNAIRKLRELGVNDDSLKNEMRSLTGKEKRTDLTVEQVQQTLETFTEWIVNIEDAIVEDREGKVENNV